MEFVKVFLVSIELNGGHIPVRVAGGIKNRVSHLPIELIVKVMSGGADTATK